MVAAAAFIALFFRYEMIPGGSGGPNYRFDRWNGNAVICLPNPANVLSLKCSTDDWQKVPAGKRPEQ